MKSFFKERSCLSVQELQGYAANQLSPKQTHEVEAHLLSCPLCADAVEGYTHHSFTEEDEAALKELEEAEIPTRRERGTRVWINRAAAILLLIIGAYAIGEYRSETRHHALFAEFYEPLPPGYLSLRGAEATNPLKDKPDLQAALEWYEGGGYEESVVFLENYLDEVPGDEQARMLMASALLGNWQATRATDILHQLERSDAVPPGDLYWYLILAHVQNNQLDSALTLLSQVEFRGERAAEAAALETKLE